jgi:predicted nucleic acid-binding protein
LFALHNFSEVIDDAFKLATDFDITVYDAAFVALAYRLNIRFLTLDQKLAKKIKDTKYFKLAECPEKETL